MQGCIFFCTMIAHENKTSIKHLLLYWFVYEKNLYYRHHHTFLLES